LCLTDGVGKTSLISTLLKEKFIEEVKGNFLALFFLWPL